MLALPGNIDFSWTRLATLSLFVQWIVLSSSAFLYLARPFLKRLLTWQSVMMSLLGVQIITLLLTLLSQVVLSPIHFEPDWQQVSRNLLAALIISAMLLRYFYIQYEVNLQQQVIHNARLDSLQANIRPHFLFNSMNIIASLIQVNPEKAEQAVEDLSDLFRASLQNTGQNNSAVVPIQKEIQISESYLRIEQQRLGNRLEVKWQIDELPERLAIPPFTLQPLVENAVYHGIQPLEAGGCITISIDIDHQTVQISVENPMPYTETISKGNQIALNNIRSRLEMLYGSKASLTTDIREHTGSKWFTVQVQYPC
ncbi:sensor histidine kinase [Endozoicomonas sp. SCSIO W0465]|uniref:sensor histidine kinase n=1 Tax=Endozoicomonas sp. SCSIO W0465 TaxID=2918516 RepID=UPI00207608B2|nr:histidine kinase [Endozoicomonas sp. SCSIO W0465]USE36534.1 histidine kinase [Endozoicomonas sp. SCSIO W0465]